MAQENDLLLNELLPEADLEEADHRDRVGAIGVPVLLEEDCDSEPDFKEFERVLTGLKAKHKVPPKYNKQRLEFLLQRYSQDFKTHYPPPKHSFNSKLNLPINRVLPQILRAILENQVAIVTGETGCGKSTQIPQLLLDYLETSGTEGKVMVIQPRRLAAINLAISIAKQTGTRIGGLVGYSIRMDHKASRSTRVLMTTYGMFLQKLTHSPSLLEEYPFVLLDEVHERDIDSDFIILALKHLLPEYPRVRLLLMSATIDTSLFESYFAKDEIDSMRARENYYFRLMRVQAKLKKLQAEDEDRALPPQKFDYLSAELKAPLLKVPSGYGAHLITKLFLEDIRRKYASFFPQQEHEFDFNHMRPLLNRKLLPPVAKIIRQILHDGTPSVTETTRPTWDVILVFLPGLNQIYEFQGKLRQELEGCKFVVDIIALHSTTFNQECARKVFQRNPPNRRVILATNIAQSSITLEGITYVIDFCLTKEVVFRPETRIECLQLLWCSQASCMQRAGRTGRVCSGLYLALLPFSFYQTMKKYAVPQMQRVSLQKVILRIKLLNQVERQTNKAAIFDDPAEVLGRSIQPPALENISGAVQGLLNSGCLECRGQQLAITDLGKMAIDLPIEINLTIALVRSLGLGVYWKMLPVVAMLSLQKNHLRSGAIESRYQQFWKFIQNDYNCDYHNLYEIFELGRTRSRLPPFVDPAVLREALKIADQVHSRFTKMGLCQRAIQRNRDEGGYRFAFAMASSFLQNLVVSEVADECDPDYTQNERRKAAMRRRQVDPEFGLLLVSSQMCASSVNLSGRSFAAFCLKQKEQINESLEVSASKLEVGLHESYLQFQQKGGYRDLRKILFFKGMQSKGPQERSESTQRVERVIQQMGDIFCPTLKKLHDVMTSYAISVDRLSLHCNVVEEDLFVCTSRMEKYNFLAVRGLCPLPRHPGLLQLLYLVFAPFGKLSLDPRSENVDRLVIRKNNYIQLNKFLVTAEVVAQANQLRAQVKQGLSFEGLKEANFAPFYEGLVRFIHSPKLPYIYEDSYWVQLYLKTLPAELRSQYQPTFSRRKDKSSQAFMSPLVLPECKKSLFAVAALGESAFLQNISLYNRWKSAILEEFENEASQIAAEKAYLVCGQCNFRICGLRCVGDLQLQSMRRIQPQFQLRELPFDQVRDPFCASLSIFSFGVCERVYGCKNNHGFAVKIAEGKVMVTPSSKLCIMLPSRELQRHRFQFDRYEYRDWESRQRQAIRSKLKERVQFTCLYCNLSLPAVSQVLKHLRERAHKEGKARFLQSLTAYGGRG